MATLLLIEGKERMPKMCDDIHNAQVGGEVGVATCEHLGYKRPQSQELETLGTSPKAKRKKRPGEATHTWNTCLAHIGPGPCLLHCKRKLN